MSVMDKAKELAEAIKETEEYKTLKSAEARLKLDPTAQDLVNNFQQKQQQVMQAQQSGQQPDPATIQSLQMMQGQLQQNETLKHLMETQKSFDEMMKQVNQTLASNLQ